MRKKRSGSNQQTQEVKVVVMLREERALDLFVVCFTTRYLVIVYVCYDGKRKVIHRVGASPSARRYA